MKGTVEERFNAKVKKVKGKNACWLWTGAKATNGYGKIGIDGKLVSAHRYAYEAASGSPIPQGMVVMHTCDVKACVNFQHLQCSSQKMNVLDKLTKGRHPTTYTRRKITPEERERIYALLDEGKSVYAVAKLVGRCEPTIHYVKNARSSAKVISILEGVSEQLKKAIADTHDHFGTAA